MSQLPPEPYELAFAADLKRLLGEIKTANGYHTDAGEKVYTAAERLDPDNDTEICVIITDPEEQLVRQDGYVRDVKLRFEAEIFVKLSSEHDARVEGRETARRVLTDIRRAVLQGFRGNSWKSQPIDVTLEGRSLPAVDAGAGFQYGVQPIVVYAREEFQSL